MKSIITTLLLTSLVVFAKQPANTATAKKDFSEWYGLWSSPKNEYFEGQIEISNCNETGCDFVFSNGNISNVCEMSARFSIVNQRSAASVSKPGQEDDDEVKSMSPCRIEFKRDKAKVTVNAEGEYCKTYCGAHGDGPFGGVFKKTKAKRK